MVIIQEKPRHKGRASYPDRDSNASLILRRDPFYPTELSRQQGGQKDKSEYSNFFINARLIFEISAPLFLNA